MMQRREVSFGNGYSGRKSCPYPARLIQILHAIMAGNGMEGREALSGFGALHLQGVGHLFGV